MIYTSFNQKRKNTDDADWMDSLFCSKSNLLLNAIPAEYSYSLFITKRSVKIHPIRVIRVPKYC